MSAAPGEGTIGPVGDEDLAELLALVRAYCDFYRVAPSDEALLAVFASLRANPAEGLQLLARDEHGVAVGFATLYWSWSTLRAGRVGIMEDLYVVPQARGRGHAERLILACADRCRDRGARILEWQTALENHRAQAVYDRLGAVRETSWVDYWLDTGDRGARGASPTAREAPGGPRPRYGGARGERGGEVD